MSQKSSKDVQTTGHVWDGDLQEYNNPLPAWWLWTFYATMVFAVIYWVMYPSWPVGKGFLKGINTISYVNDKGMQVTSSWNTRALLMKDMNEAAAKQKPYFDKVAATPFDKIKSDPDLNSFIVSAGKVMFQDNCAACHQSGGQGKMAFAPNLTDDDWIYGGSYEKIQETITNGRHGIMPAKGGNAALTDAQVTDLANYVLSLSGEKVDAGLAAKGNELFHGAGTCFACHGADGKGNQAIGSANLTDKIWLWANVPAADTAEKKVAAVKEVITTGLNKGVMPAWQGRLSAEQIKLLAAYVHELGGGK